MNSSQHKTELRRRLLAHYDAHGRELPWRIRPETRAKGIRADPYAVWLSEIMCQQTTVAAVTPYWKKFQTRWPNVSDLAAAPLDDVLSAWAGLGYYARARNLHKCATIIVEDFKGVFPNTEAELLSLPGIGRYTAAAIAAICYGAPSNVVDGNVERVISRLYTVETPLPKAKTELYELAGELIDRNRAEDYPQALMDLGATVCRPKSPKCNLCPWSPYCQAFQMGNQNDFPKRMPKKSRPKRYGAAFYLENNGKIFLRKRPNTGLLGGMMELPGTEWTEEKPDLDVWLNEAPACKNWQRVEEPVIHVFTHFELELWVFVAQGLPDHGIDQFVSLHGLKDQALPSLMQKAIQSVYS